MPAPIPSPAAPNTGRILDVWLGGEHHFPPDIGAAGAFAGIYPAFPRVFGLLRDFIGRASRFVAKQGVDQFLVIGAGIPTRGNVHEAVPNCRVLYTDLDTVNVELGKRILMGSTKAAYAPGDACDVPALIRSEAFQMNLDLERPLGVVFVGVAAFMTDGQLTKSYADLFAELAPGSFVVADFDGEGLGHFPQTLEMLKAGGSPLYMRNPAQIGALLGDWRTTDDGILPVEAWQNPSDTRHRPVFMYGCVVKK